MSVKQIPEDRHREIAEVSYTESVCELAYSQGGTMSNYARDKKLERLYTLDLYNKMVKELSPVARVPSATPLAGSIM